MESNYGVNKVINYICPISDAIKKGKNIYQGLSFQADTIGKTLFSSVHSGLIPAATASERSGSD